jgi:Uma2 family endonuclease
MVATQTSQTYALTYLDRERAMADVSDDDSRRYELLGGEEVVSPSPTTGHQSVSGNTYFIIRTFADPRKLGRVFTAPTDVRLSAYDVVVPDLCFVSRARSSIISQKAIEGPSDLVVEILSPSTRRQDQVRKFALYAAGGIREYWLIDIDVRSLTNYTLRDGQYVAMPEQDGTVASVMLSGLVVTVGDLFEGIP